MKSTEGFDVRVVMVYRIFLTRFSSWYNEFAKRASYNPTYSDYLSRSEEIYDVGDEGVDCFCRQNLAFEGLFERYSAAFGSKHVTILDYYGVQAAGKTLDYVFFCELMGLLCHDKIELDAANTQTDLTARNLDYTFELFALMRGCSYNSKSEHVIEEKLLSFKSKLPVVSYKLSMLKELSEYMDRDIRRKYSRYMLYSNETASMVALRKSQIKEIDPLLRGKEAKSWMTEAGNLLKDLQESHLVTCS